MSRADKISPKAKIPEYFSDFHISLNTNPLTGQLAKVVNEEAVKQAITNLVLTDKSERPYQPHLGSDVKRSLFDLMDDPLTMSNIEDSIRDCISQNEHRAEVVNVEVIASPDYNAYTVNVLFSLNNITEIFTASINISRIR